MDRQQSIEEFAGRWERFVLHLFELHTQHPLEQSTVHGVATAGQRLLSNVEQCRKVRDELEAAERTVVQLRSEYSRLGNERDTCYLEAAVAAQVAIQSAESHLTAAREYSQRLRDALGWSEAAKAGSTAATSAPTALPLPAPMGLAVLRRENGINVLTWDTSPFPAGTTFEVAAAVADGLWRGKPQDPQAASNAPESWHHRETCTAVPYEHAAITRDGRRVSQDVVVWYRVRALQETPGMAPGPWSDLLTVQCVCGAASTETDVLPGPRFTLWGSRRAA